MVEKRATAAVKAAENGRGKELYSITKSITGKKGKEEIRVEDKQRVLRTETKHGLQRWVKHFNEILNRDDATNPVEEHEIAESEEIEEIDLGRW